VSPSLCLERALCHRVYVAEVYRRGVARSWEHYRVVAGAFSSNSWSRERGRNLEVCNSCVCVFVCVSIQFANSLRVYMRLYIFYTVYMRVCLRFYTVCKQFVCVSIQFANSLFAFLYSLRTVYMRLCTVYVAFAYSLRTVYMRLYAYSLCTVYMRSYAYSLCTVCVQFICVYMRTVCVQFICIYMRIVYVQFICVYMHTVYV
jgi:hypothetical protein